MTQITGVTQALQAALEAVNSAGIPEDLRPVAFAKAFDTLGMGAPAVDQSRHMTMAKTTNGDGLAMLAARLGLAPAVVDGAFVLESGRIEVVIPPGRFEVAKSRATEQIALLVAAARQGAGIDDDGWTSVDRIREECENFKRYDSSNFATTIKEMDDVFTVRGSGRDRKVRMTAPAWQRAAELLSSLSPT
jgi:hypothetical protein